jgi:hypothetical protein
MLLEKTGPEMVLSFLFVRPAGSGRNLRRPGGGVSSATARRENACPGTENMMERVVERENMKRTYRRVAGNSGSAGVDGVRVEELKALILFRS